MNSENRPIKVSFITVSYNSASKIEQLIHSIIKTIKDFEYEIFVVDNNSQDDTINRVKNISSEIKVISNSSNVGFATANNQAFKIATGNFILIINPDILLTEHTRVKDLCERLQMNKNIGIIAPRLHYSDGTIQESARGFPNPLAQLVRGFKLEKYFGSRKFYKKFILDVRGIKNEESVDWVIGAFMLMRKDVLEEVGYFDPGYFMYYEDADLCIRLKKLEYSILYNPSYSATHIYHRDSARKPISKLKAIHIQSIFRFYFKHLFYLLFK